ncbi:hypothetical protein N7523_008782 [Penicillium sp. IBT 18751x]|nr:hypothetical protein N7523_008782 [Penicillium sp. IBT 18751x]
MLFRPTQGEDEQPVEGSEDRFISSDVYIWPRDDAPSEIYQILCPESRLSSMHAVSDERSIIYSVSSAGLPRDHQAIILISFDPTIHLPGLRSLHKMKRLMVPGDNFPVEVPRLQSPDTSIVQVAAPLLSSYRL